MNTIIIQAVQRYMGSIVIPVYFDTEDDAIRVLAVVSKELIKSNGRVSVEETTEGD